MVKTKEERNSDVFQKASRELSNIVDVVREERACSW